MGCVPRSGEGTFQDCPFFAGAGLEAWDVRGGQDFAGMFYGCVGLRADLSGWRLGRHRQISLHAMLGDTEGAEVGSLEGWAEERRGEQQRQQQGPEEEEEDVAGVGVQGMLAYNRGSIATPRWARRAKDFQYIRGCYGEDPWAGKGA